jgi:phosphoketolase
MVRNRIALAMIALIVGAAATGELMAEAVTLHVATNGKDTWSGRLAAPKLIEHKQYIHKHGQDMPEIRNWKWNNPK